jgi:hypothetical protein
MCLEDRPILEPNAAGIDIGAMPPDRDEHPVRVFSTFTEDLRKMAKWLVSCGITTAAMESTGVCWIPPYEVLEQHVVKPWVLLRTPGSPRRPYTLAVWRRRARRAILCSSVGGFRMKSSSWRFVGI